MRCEAEYAQAAHRSRTLIGLLLLATLALFASDARAYEHRRRTPSVGGKLQYGCMGVNSDWSDVFRWGRGCAVSIRQYVARSQAIGLSFEQQRFKRRSDLPQSSGIRAADEIQFQTLMFDYYIYFHRMYRRTPYLVFSGGFYRPQRIYEFTDIAGHKGSQVDYPSEGFLARIGGGLEYFVTRNFSIDATVSGYYISAPGIDGTTLTTEAALGIQLYVGP